MKHDSPRILLIDSASSAVMRIGLSSSEGNVTHLEIHERFQYSEMIIRMINDLLQKERLKIGELNAIIICTGPGSFTGLRVGMAIAKGLATALGIPVVGVSIFKAISDKLYRKYGHTAVIIPSRREEYYVGMIESPEFEESKIAVIPSRELKDFVGDKSVLGVDCTNDSLQEVQDRIIVNPDDQPNMNDLFMAGCRKLKAGDTDDILLMEPLYVQKFATPKPK